ncbi:MAG TPA: aminotransferase class III-fold pyridoxal phosphate-dependent enzyme [Steroidobacteraceae bacterium]|nr:aminotransferase class III-fold pyridoxal phosphate-dependent enzyme [Steroidobacteraceae bacterium]
MTTAGRPDHAPAIDAAILRAEHAYAAANPLSRARHERAGNVLPGGHSRQTLFFAPFPLTIAGGRDARITDLDGHDYLNLVGDYAAGVYGHTCAPIQQAVADAMQAGVSLSGLNTQELELAELITRRIPSMEQIRFCNSGSEACLFASQVARHATNRAKLLVFNGCYHGGFMIYGPVDPPLSVPFPLVKATYNDVPGTRAILRSNRSDIAAVLVEPMMGSGGAIPATGEFLAMLREETRRLGMVLIFDEVMTSRLAPGGVQGLRGIDPDLTTLGKFWGGGFAFGAFGGSRQLMRHLDTTKGGVLSQGGTFNNNIVAMTAGLVGARDVYTPEACIKLNSLGDSLRLQLNALGRSLGLSFHATGLGGVLNTQWNDAGLTEPSQVEAATTPVRRLFQLEMIARGYFVAQRGMMTLSLPMTEGDIKGFVGEVRDYLTRHADILPRSST